MAKSVSGRILTWVMCSLRSVCTFDLGQDDTDLDLLLS